MSVNQPKVFISYAHEDDAERAAIVQELKILQLDVWVDREISAGSEWNEEIQRQLNEADIIVLLISRPFLSSEFVTHHELPRALERHAEKSARVIPVLVKKTSWEHLPVSKLNAVPADSKWMTGGDWHSINDAVTSVAQSIKKASDDLMAEREQRRQEEQKAEERRRAEERKAEDEYRREVAEALSDHEITPLERVTLDEERVRLGISEDRAKEIEAGVLQPIEQKRQNIAKYEESVAIAFEHGGYVPFGPEWRADLDMRKAKLGLTDEDVAGVAEKVTERLQAARDAQEEAARKAAEEEAARKAKAKAEEEEAARKAKEDDEAYRRQVAKLVSGGKITKAKREKLNALRSTIEISDEAAEEIERVELEAAKEKAAAERETKAAAKKRRSEAIAEALNGFKDGEGLFLGQDIPEKKLLYARSSSEIPESEIILGLLDNTVMGSAKNHMVFTDTGMYYRNGSQRVKIPYEKLKKMSCSPSPGDKTHTVVGEHTFWSISWKNEAVVEMLEAVKQQL
jgi:hypothetical protein